MSLRVPGRRVRRALVPLLMAAELALAALFVVVAAIGVMVWPFTRRRRLLRLSCFGAVHMAVELAALTVCGWYWIRMVVGRRQGDWWVDAHNTLLSWALTVIVRAGRLLLGFEVQLTEPPDTLPLTGDRPALVLARHGGLGDSFALVQLLLARYHRRVRIVVKELLALDPALDVLLHRLDCVFVPGGTNIGLTSKLAAVATGLGSRDALLLFPEGGNWTPRRLESAIRRLRRRAPARQIRMAEGLEYVLPPRAGGVLTCLSARPDLDIVFVAHTGLEELLTPTQVWAHLPLDTPMSVRWWTAGSRPPLHDSRAAEDWLALEWAVIDEWIGSQAERGRRLDPADS